MIYNENSKNLIEKVLISLEEKRKNNEIVAGTVEIINAHFQFDPRDKYIDFGSIKKAPRKYIEKELEWYLSKSRNIHPYMDDIKLWNQICTEDGMINSNYGWCVYSPENSDGNNSQFDYALKQLLSKPDGRQSVIFYNRPQMQWEWNDRVHANHDFTCTLQTQHFIRNNKLEYIVYQRSLDLIFGLINDFAWHCYVYEDLKKYLPNVEYGTIHWNAGSLHCYERDWEKLHLIVEEYQRECK
jgi:thymidylate synthase